MSIGAFLGAYFSSDPKLVKNGSLIGSLCFLFCFIIGMVLECFI